MCLTASSWLLPCKPVYHTCDFLVVGIATCMKMRSTGSGTWTRLYWWVADCTLRTLSLGIHLHAKRLYPCIMQSHVLLQDMKATKIRTWTNRRYTGEKLLTPFGMRERAWTIMDSRLSYVAICCARPGLLIVYNRSPPRQSTQYDWAEG